MLSQDQQTPINTQPQAEEDLFDDTVGLIHHQGV